MMLLISVKRWPLIGEGGKDAKCGHRWSVWGERVGVSWMRLRKRYTHECGLPAGHDGAHVCDRCRAVEVKR